MKKIIFDFLKIIALGAMLGFITLKLCACCSAYHYEIAVDGAKCFEKDIIGATENIRITHQHDKCRVTGIKNGFYQIECCNERE